jgi:nicotinate-nucleotide pyrophosphorylase (carboxylating)
MAVMTTGFPFSPAVDRLIELALTEDLSAGDLTSDILFDDEVTAEAQVLAKSPLVVAGLPVFRRVIERVDPRCRYTALVAEGDRVPAGAVLATLVGPARSVLRAERTALNFLRHLSGVATLTAEYVEAAGGVGPRVCDTRKTRPGFRELEKYAVRVGGGWNHRFNLGAAAMVKDNHIVAAGSITAAVEHLRKRLPHTTSIEVETTRLEQVDEALAARADIIMLDNMSNEEMSAAVKLCAGRAVTEASGGITLERIRDLGEVGVDVVSVGALTHSAPAADISLDVVVGSREEEAERELRDFEMLAESTGLGAGTGPDAGGAVFHKLDEVTSTNDVARRALLAGAPHGSVYRAEWQQSGRGRLGRIWLASHGDLMMSVLLKPTLPPSRVSLVTLAAAVAVREVLSSHGLAARIKWPNDLLVDDRKIAGILVEGVLEGHRMLGCVVGVGVNIHFDIDEIARSAGPSYEERLIPGTFTSFAQEGVRAPDLDALARRIGAAIVEWVRAIEVYGVDDMLTAWRTHSGTLGRRLAFVLEGEERAGVAVDIDNDGGLVVETDDGERVSLHSGEVQFLSENEAE